MLVFERDADPHAVRVHRTPRPAACMNDACRTSFPNPVNYGMTFNKSLVYDLGAIIGVETRALWLAGAVEASTWSGRPHIGLDAWSPNSE